MMRRAFFALNFIVRAKWSNCRSQRQRYAKKTALEMGVVRGQTDSVVRAAPLDDPIEIKVRSAIFVRREEASMIR
jgi:Fe2+ transport system protein FeoA